MADHNGGPVKSIDVANNVVESSEVVQSGFVAVATPKQVTQEAARRQLQIYQGAYIDGFIQEVDSTPTKDIGVCDMIVSHQLFEKVSDDHKT